MASISQQVMSVQSGHATNDDADMLCRFEGLTREGIPHGRGVLVMGNGGGGGGIQNTARGDRHA